MDSQHAGAGELVAGVSGLLLLLVMFLPWFGVDAVVDIPGSRGPVTVSGRGVDAWEAFRVIDVVLCASAGLAVALGVFRGAALLPRDQRLTIVVALAAAVSALLIVYRLIDPPRLPAESVDTPVEISRRLGAFFGLLCTAGMAWGANRAIGRRPGAVPVEPAPPAPPRDAPALAGWSHEAVEAECGLAWRRYERRLAARYTTYFERHPELRGRQRYSARDLQAALPPGWGALGDAVPGEGWSRQHLSGKSGQTLTVGLLGVAAERDPSLAWLWGALGPLVEPAAEQPHIEFEHRLDPGVLGQQPRQMAIDVLVDDPRVMICIEAKWREAGIGRCACRRDGGDPVEGRCAHRVERREAYWSAAGDLLGLPPRQPPGPCPISLPYQAVRVAAAARALSGPGRLAVFALIYDAANPYFAGQGGWPGWPEVLRTASARSPDPRLFRFAAISWQELVPTLPLDDATRVWAAEKHGLG